MMVSIIVQALATVRPDRIFHCIAACCRLADEAQRMDLSAVRLYTNERMTENLEIYRIRDTQGSTTAWKMVSSVSSSRNF